MSTTPSNSALLRPILNTLAACYFFGVTFIWVVMWRRIAHQGGDSGLVLPFITLVIMGAVACDVLYLVRLSYMRGVQHVYGDASKHSDPASIVLLVLLCGGGVLLGWVTVAYINLAL